jgi:hypothetical protein
MPFKDFKRPWIIVESTVSCQHPDIVRIDGTVNDSVNEVLIFCGKELYEPGKYFDRNLEEGKEERVARLDEGKVVYEIFFIEKNPENGKARIKATFGEGQIGGSWTAEDNTGSTDED